MSEQYRRLKERYETVNERMRRISEAINTLQSVLIDADAEQRATKLEMDALQYEGDSEFNEAVGRKERK